MDCQDVPGGKTPSVLQGRYGETTKDQQETADKKHMKVGSLHAIVLIVSGAVIVIAVLAFFTVRAVKKMKHRRVHESDEYNPLTMMSMDSAPHRNLFRRRCKDSHLTQTRTRLRNQMKHNKSSVNYKCASTSETPYPANKYHHDSILQIHRVCETRRWDHDRQYSLSRESIDIACDSAILPSHPL